MVSELRSQVSRNPNRAALIYPAMPFLHKKNLPAFAQKIVTDKKITYRQLWEKVVQVSNLLVNLGVNRGDRVGILMPNIPQFVFVYYGSIMAGAICVPINYMTIVDELKRNVPVKNIKLTDEIEAQILDSKPKVIFLADFFWPIIKQMQNKISWKCQFVLTSPGAFLPFPLPYLYPIKARQEGKFIGQRDASTLQKLEKLIGNKQTSQNYDCPNSYHRYQIAQILYTGGTTGAPKGVALTHFNLISNIRQIRKHLGILLKEGEIVLGALPFFHSYGLTAVLNMTLLSLGGTVVLMPKFDSQEAVFFIRKYGITIFPGVAKMYESIVKINAYISRGYFHSLKLCVNGAGPINAKICQEFKELTGARIVEGYGLTETSPVISVRLPNEPEELSNIGRPVPDTQIKIIKEDGTVAGINEEGELLVRGPQVMKGYWLKNNETKAVFDGVWLKTGDIVKIDKDGFLHFCDRIKELITVCGENVYPSKIEKVLSNILSEFVIIGLKDAEMEKIGIPSHGRGESPIIIIPQNAFPSEKEEQLFILEKCLNAIYKNLPSQYHPSAVFIVKTLEKYKTPIGKILKRKIKEAVIAGDFLKLIVVN